MRSKKKIDYKLFKKTINRLMDFDWKLDGEDIDDLIQDWYIMFKEQRFETVKEFVNWNFNPKEVNKNTHPYWIRS